MSVPFAFVDVTTLSESGYKVVIVACVLIVMLLLMVSGRLTSRRLNRAGVGADDHVLLIATILTMGLCAIAIAFPVIDQRIEPVGQWFMAWMIMYGLSIAFSKCAILLLYIRVFTTIKRTFTITSWLMGFLVLMTGLANIFGAIFQCSPVAFAWDKTLPSGNCMDIVAFSRYTAIPNVVTGAVMLIMPLPIVWNLNIDVSAKIALTATFLHGIIGFIASCARLTILFSTQTPHTSFTRIIWTINEPANYLIAACLPTLRPIFTRIFPPSFFILTHRRDESDGPDQLKTSWPKGVFGDGGFLSSSRLSGPWYGNGGEGAMGEKGDGKKGAMGGAMGALRVEGHGPIGVFNGEGERAGREIEEPAGKSRRSYTLQRSEAYDIDKRQVLVEKVVEEEAGEVEEGKRVEEGGV